MDGLHEVRKDIETDTWRRHTRIITRAVRNASGEVRDLMPVFLTEDVWTGER